MPLQVGIYLFDEVEVLDFAGPFEVFSTASRLMQRDGQEPPFAVHTIAPGTGTVRARGGLRVKPEYTLSDHPQLDVLIIPGGVVSAELDRRNLSDWLLAQSLKLKVLASVCTGAFLLGAAGLLRGYRATTHWSSLPLLASYGAIPVEERVVLDRDRLTGAGVTAGIDLALQLAALLSSREVAEAIQLGLEYDPAPPFNAGHPRTASPSVVQRVRDRFADRIARRTEQARRQTP